MATQFTPWRERKLASEAGPGRQTDLQATDGAPCDVNVIAESPHTQYGNSHTVQCTTTACHRPQLDKVKAGLWPAPIVATDLVNAASDSAPMPR
jgi:hypothetical protein